MKNDLIVLI